MLRSDLVVLEAIQRHEALEELDKQAQRFYSPSTCPQCGHMEDGMQAILPSAILDAPEPFAVWGDGLELAVYGNGLELAVHCETCNSEHITPDGYKPVEWRYAVEWATEQQRKPEEWVDYLAGREAWLRGYEKGQNNG